MLTLRYVFTVVQRNWAVDGFSRKSDRCFAILLCSVTAFVIFGRISNADFISYLIII